MQLLTQGKAKGRKKPDLVKPTLCLETLIDHSFTAASREGPGRADEEPDKGDCTYIQVLCQAEVVRCLYSIHFCTPMACDGH